MENNDYMIEENIILYMEFPIQMNSSYVKYIQIVIQISYIIIIGYVQG